MVRQTRNGKRGTQRNLSGAQKARSGALLSASGKSTAKRSRSPLSRRGGAERRNGAVSREISYLKNLLDSTQIATLFLDRELRIMDFNSAMVTIFPVRDGDRGRLLSAVVTHLPYDELQRDVKKVLHTLSSIEREVTRVADGEIFLMRVLPYRTVDGRIECVVLTFVDITERKHYKQEQARLAAIVESSDDAIVSKDLDGIIQTWNGGAERLFGYTAEEAIGRSIRMLVPPDRADEEDEILARMHKGQRFENHETVRLRKGGSLVDISLTVSPVRDADGRVIGASKIARDITERRRAEAFRALMVDELNHRVKNMLATVQSIAAQSLQGTDVDPQFREVFESRLIALSKAHNLLTSENWEGAPLRELLREGLEPYRAKGRARIAIDGPDVRLSPKSAVALAMAFHELATNAAKYGALSNATGRVSVSWHIDTEQSDTLRLKWAESGGPLVQRPRRRGFGARLIEHGLSLELNGHAQLDFEPSGLICSIEMALPRGGGEMTNVRL
jgi:two-component system CheB/CheR fusion protein